MMSLYAKAAIELPEMAEEARDALTGQEHLLERESSKPVRFEYEPPVPPDEAFALFDLPYRPRPARFRR